MFVAVVVIQTFGYSEMFVSYMHLLVSTSYINPHGPKNTSNPILDRPTVNAPFSSYERTPSRVWHPLIGQATRPSLPDHFCANGTTLICIVSWKGLTRVMRHLLSSTNGLYPAPTLPIWGNAHIFGLSSVSVFVYISREIQMTNYILSRLKNESNAVDSKMMNTVFKESGCRAR